MKAVAFASFGGPEVMRVMEFPDPQVGPGQVRVRVKAAGVQHFDCGVRRGHFPPSVTVNLPQIPGNEFAGIVDQIGEGVTDFVVGSEVLGFGILNCYAEYVVASVSQIVHKPKGMAWEEAGGFSGNAQGAHMALEAIGVAEGETILIHGAAGALGTFAVQLARAWGAKTVIGTASVGNHDYLRALGAVPVTYGDGLVERVRALAPQGVDAAFDTNGAEGVMASVALVKDRSRIITFVASELNEPLGLGVVRGQRSVARLAELVELHATGSVRIHLRQTFPHHQVEAAHRLIETGHGRGKVVITFD